MSAHKRFHAQRKCLSMHASENRKGKQASHCCELNGAACIAAFQLAGLRHFSTARASVSEVPTAPGSAQVAHTSALVLMRVGTLFVLQEWNEGNGRRTILLPR